MCFNESSSVEIQTSWFEIILYCKSTKTLVTHHIIFHAWLETGNAKATPLPVHLSCAQHVSGSIQHLHCYAIFQEYVQAAGVAPHGWSCSLIVWVSFGAHANLCRQIEKQNSWQISESLCMRLLLSDSDEDVLSYSANPESCTYSFFPHCSSFLTLYRNHFSISDLSATCLVIPNCFLRCESHIEWVKSQNWKKLSNHSRPVLQTVLEVDAAGCFIVQVCI